MKVSLGRDMGECKMECVCERERESKREKGEGCVGKLAI